MSKLYDVISRLDEIASLAGNNQVIPEIPFQQANSKGNSSLLRILLLCGTLIFLGLVVVGMTAWWQDWFDLRKGTSVPTAQNTIAIPADAPTPGRPVLLEKFDEPIDSTVSIAFTTTPTGKELRQQGGDDSIDEIKRIPENDFYNESPIISDTLPQKAVIKNRLIKVQQLVVADFTIEPQPLQISEVTESAADGIIEQTAQLSRWLHQAEQHRRTGDWEGAVVLFAKVWQESKNPAVANNLAASLIQMDRLTEARVILQQALNKVPHDQDLKQNLQLVQQLEHR